MADQESKTTPNEFFQAIGQKVESTDDDQQLVEEIESLCMTCQKNVRDTIPYHSIFMTFADTSCRESPACS